MWARGCFLSPPPPLRGPPPPLTQGRLGYAPFSRRITQYQLPPPMRGKWRAQRADRGAHAARGFVGGATFVVNLKNLPCGAFQCRTRLCGWCSFYGVERSRLIDVSMPHAALWVVQHGAAKCLAFCEKFQCRTRLCGWCSNVQDGFHN